MTDQPEQERPPEVLADPGGRTLGDLWRRRSARSRAVIAGTTVAVLALGGTVAYAATAADSGTARSAPAASASPSPGGSAQRGGPWFWLGGEGVHGESTVKDRDTGKWVVRTWQRGEVTKTDGDQVTVKSDDGTSWTWTVGTDTSVLPDRATLKQGASVFVAGTRDGDRRTADRVASGTYEGKRGQRGGFPGFGWGRGDERSSAAPGAAEGSGG